MKYHNLPRNIPSCVSGHESYNMIWLVVSIPLKNMSLLVSWDDEIPNIWENEIHVPVTTKQSCNDISSYVFFKGFPARPMVVSICYTFALEQPISWVTAVGFNTTCQQFLLDFKATSKQMNVKLCDENMTASAERRILFVALDFN